MDGSIEGRSGLHGAWRPRRAADPPLQRSRVIAQQFEHSMRVPAFCAGLTCILVSGLALGAPAVQSHGNSVPPEPTVVHTGAQAALPAARVDAALKDYDRWLDQLAAENRTAGLATAVVVNDKVRYERTLGYADANTGARVEPGTV